MKPVYVNAVGLVAPGLPGWHHGHAVLKGEAPFVDEPLTLPKPARLPTNERRRATELIRLAFQVCADAVDGRDLAVDQLASVFASSGGDYHIVDQIFRALSKPERQVSPTQFHNSVHNAAAGYWSIATGSQAPSTSLSGHDFTVSAGLLEAALLCNAEQRHTLFAVYDVQPPEPLLTARPIAAPFAAALLLSPDRGPDAIAALQCAVEPAAAGESAATDPALETVRQGNPAARILPLLTCLARQQNDTVHLAMAGTQTLTVEVSTCR
ncbi:MAG TPA: hypothetical protein ENJ19_09780 [Gammaproteobacteria bacterium]|nr:hypothetical protein [Gammaproteobacteria bacterium]